MTIRWVTAFLDSPSETAGASEAFWLGVTGGQLSTQRGERAEFATILPPDGDPFIKVQRVVQSSPGAMHLDLHSDEVPALAALVERLGGTTSYHKLGYVVCGSPGGLTFCLVGHPGHHRASPLELDGGCSLVDQVCLDIPPSQHDAEVRFWCHLTGWTLVDLPSPEFQRLRRPAGVPLAFLLQLLDEEQPTVTAHLDLACDDRDHEVDRHVGLGAEMVRRTDGFTVLRDPAGRRYCVTGRRPGDV